MVDRARGMIPKDLEKRLNDAEIREKIELRRILKRPVVTNAFKRLLACAGVKNP